MSGPPPYCGLHDDDQPAVAKAPKSVPRSCTCGTERTSDWGSPATALCEGELPAAQSLRAEDPSRLTSSCSAASSTSCFFALGGNLEPPPPVQHDAHAYRGSDHDHSRGRPPVREDGGQDGNAHAGQDRMPLGARSPLHVFTLTAVEHHELTPWIRFGNRQSARRAEVMTLCDRISGGGWAVTCNRWRGSGATPDATHHMVELRGLEPLTPTPPV